MFPRKTLTRAGERETAVERIATDLLPRASRLTRLVIRRTGGEISGADRGILRTLSDGPWRITELAGPSSSGWPR